MARLRGKELSELYPVPKTFEELESARIARSEIRRTKFAAVKIGCWATCVPIITGAAYWLIRGLMGGNTGSAGTALFAVCFSMLISMIALALIYYFYSLVEAVVSRIFVEPGKVYTSLIVVLFLSSGALVLLPRHQMQTELLLAVVALSNWVVSSVVVEYMRKRKY